MNRDDFVRVPETRRTWTEAWRHECECRFLFAMPLAQRRLWIEGTPPDEFGHRERVGIRGRRGDAAVDRIMRRIGEMMDAQAAAKASRQGALL